MNWWFRKLHFVSDEFTFRLGIKRFIIVFEGFTFKKKIEFILGKVDLSNYQFGISLSSLFSINFHGWKGPDIFGGYPYLSFEMSLLGISLFIACEDTREDKQREIYVKEKGHVLDQEL